MISLPQIESVLAAAFGEGRSEESGEQGPALAVESGEDGAIVLFTTLDITREEANAALRAARLSGGVGVRGRAIFAFFAKPP